MSKYNVLNVNRVNVKIDNSGDESRLYEIEVNVEMREGNIESLDSGIVRKDGELIASFSAYGNEQNVNWQNVDTEVKCSVQSTIDAMINELKSSKPTLNIKI